jgi:transposase
VDFPPDSGEDRRASREIMTKRPRRNHAPAFKAKVALAALKGQKTLIELAQAFDMHLFGSDASNVPLPLDLLRAKIGELALGNAPDAVEHRAAGSLLGVIPTDGSNHAVRSDREHEIRMARIALPKKTPSGSAAPSDHLNIPAADGDGELNGLNPGRQRLIGHHGLLVRIVTDKSYGITESPNARRVRLPTPLPRP